MDTQELGGEERGEIFLILPGNYQFGLGGRVLGSALGKTNKSALVDGKSVVDYKSSVHFRHALSRTLVNSVSFVTLILKGNALLCWK